MLEPKVQQITKTDINRIKQMINEGMSHRQIAKTTGWSVYTISKIRNGFYDIERQCQTVDINPLENENLFLKSEIERLKKELSTKEMLYKISNERRYELEEENKKLQTLKNNTEHSEPLEQKKTIKFGSHKTYDTDLSKYESHSFGK